MEIAKKFEQAERAFFDGWMKRDPFLAVDCGLHDYDDRLPDPTFDKVQDDIKFFRRALGDFKKLEGKKFTHTRQIDLELILHTIQLKLFELEEEQLWSRVPNAPRMIGKSIFQLLSRNYAPLKQRLASVVKRLDKLPKYIEQSQTRLVNPVKSLIEGELETITRIPGFFHVVKDVARNALSMAAFERMCLQIEDVHNALENYSDWLIVNVLSKCGDDFPVGEDLFRRHLKARGITEPPAKMLTNANKEMTRMHEKMREAARKIKRKARIEDVRDQIRQHHHDNFDGIMRYVRDSVGKARDFVVRSNFAPLPENDHLFVTETPTYLRHFLPLGGYLPPARFEEKKEGFYFVTPGDCDSDRRKEHNYASLSNMTVHEGFPGHHLQAAWQVRHPSLARAFARAPETIEGWAHYCEEHVKDLGYEDTPSNRFMMYSDMHWRAARVMLDIRLHSGKIPINKAVEVIIDEAGLDRVSSEAEIRRYLIRPTYPLSYFYGKERMKDLKKWARERMKNRFDEKFFHTAVLQSGALPTALLKRDLEWKIDDHLRKLEAEATAAALVRRKEKADARAKAKEVAKAKSLAKKKERDKAKAKAKAKAEVKAKAIARAKAAKAKAKLIASAKKKKTLNRKPNKRAAKKKVIRQRPRKRSQ